ncbi:Bug family tripartite tricarboxylate transporter substrate binding protein [Xenophilus azovorans]|uniref:Bug family tripartite tricarboxylate transporter substrate binding protein n=1 Tax=Xenophilus azovorans TaxID=151755 RepID=UPI000570184B|nr:tripartite tricarboxylate transporter substrate binding protein [Xenophilus azovorans]
MDKQRRLLLSALGCAPLAARAQEVWPSRPITAVVPFGPGGNADILARDIAQIASRALKQQIVIDNKAGSAGAVGIGAVARARADGYVIGLASLSQLASLHHLRKTPLSYNPTRDFEPLTFIGQSAPLWLVAKPATGFRNVRDLVNHARTHPGKLTYGSDGVGSLTHIPGAQLAREAGIDIVHVPYRGGSFAIQGLLTGEIDCAFTGVPGPVEHVKSGRIVALGTCSEKRSAPDPNLPTVAEQGFPGFHFRSWWGFVAPAGTPRDVVQRLGAELAKAVQDPALKSKLEAQGYEVVGSTPEQFRSVILKDNQVWAQLARDLNIQVEE